MKEYTFLAFIFVISIGILFLGSGITGLYTLDFNYNAYCSDKSSCSSGEVCCAFMEGDNVFRMCSNDCKALGSLSQEANHNEQTLKGFNLGITGSGIQDVESKTNPWIFILIGLILILLALFYRKNPKTPLIYKDNKRKKKR